MQHSSKYKDPYLGYREFTLRGVILGILITIIFTASNIYLGLKVGLTFASSIPAAVISMAVLRYAKNSNILENNFVQTQASAAGTLSSVVFVIPGLLMMGYWQGFPFWQTTLLCLSGGILGVIFTVPLRRIMVVKSSLPYPEGVAAAEILKAGTIGNVANEHGSLIQHPQGDESTKSSHAKEIVFGGVLAAIVSLLNSGFRVVSDSASFWFKSGSAIFQLPMGFSLALLGAGSLMGISAGCAIFLGIFIAWGVAIPILSSIFPQPEHMQMAAFAKQLWVSKVRFIGVGTIGIAAIWTLIILFKPMVEGVRLSIAAYTSTTQSSIQAERSDRDLNPKYMLLITILMVIILFSTFYSFVATSGLDVKMAWALVLLMTVITFVIGFLIAAACGYMAGLVGSSSSPISGIGILSVLVFAVILLMVGNFENLTGSTQGVQFLTALTLFGTSAVLAVATISNDNLQDLKTGYLIHATPQRQQIALIIGSITGALVIAPLLQLLYHAYGFSGAMPRANMDPSQALAAPQAVLMTTISQGIFSHQLQWNYIFIGVMIGVLCILLDFILKKISHNKMGLPVLAIGMGIYLPPSVNMPLFIGAVMFWLIKKYVKKQTSLNDQENKMKQLEQRGTLFAAGLIVGESLMGVILAILIVISTGTGGSDSPIAIPLKDWDHIADYLGLALFILTIFIFVQRCLKFKKN
ncbi:oligopeptide transporter, OPT family [Acinetobacter sp. B10A]|uniref:OPT family oligopeptide transporter n=1 Tax=Acinetobacter baretiae TaxID=2605383 RepID=UPI001B3C5D1A|nr:oligopeptide transporter, OPT family [Acinetobacter baretiae]MBF7685330.1 oligopeptide transporter, OPT family [Acinetobacter baretiae]